MAQNGKDISELLGVVGTLRDELAKLDGRIAKLEAMLPGVSETTGKPPAAAPQLDEELLVAIGAAIAAFLGVKPHIRQIRLIRDATWVQAGRATIQASHAINVHHG
jgi:methylmalonyl-CoA carboxyltransferase large subunit